MLSLKGRIYISYAIFGLILVILAFIAFQFVQKATKVRTIQNDILSINNKILLLTDVDNALRTQDVINPDFFKDGPYERIEYRNKIQKEIINDADKIEALAEEMDLLEGEELKMILNDFESYEALNISLLSKLKKRGFRNEGLEGIMRSYAHKIEEYPEIIRTDQILMLRRHEKDYFLRSDTVYVNKFNRYSQALINNLNTQDPLSSQIAELIRMYHFHFNEIVELETQIGDLDGGLLAEVNKKKKELIKNLSELSEKANARSNMEVKRIFNQILTLSIIGLIIASLIGYLSAGIVSSSIKNLAKSMHREINSNFSNKVFEPSKYSARETKSLYASYKSLISTIQAQLHSLEIANEKLGERNTELNVLIQRVKESEENLKSSNELKNKFFSIIAHDLKSPISSLSMLLEYMTKNKEDISKEIADDYLQKLYESSSSISVLLDNLLSWARNQNNHLIPVKKSIDLQPIFDEIEILNSQRLEEKKISFQNQIPENTTIIADKDMMHLVFRNLIDNAIKYTPEEGEIKIHSQINKSHLKILVSDTGVGLKKEDQKKLFKSLVKDQKKGTNGETGIGLGLMLAYDFVSKNGGNLKVESEPDIGTTFIIKFPLA